MVLAAGLGTRLRPLSHEIAKPLVPLGDRPVLGHIAAHLSAGGLTEIVVNTHHRYEDFRFESEDLGATFHSIHEKEILGTAGGIHGARPLFGVPPVVVWNGDIVAEPPLADLMRLAAPGGLVFAVAPRARGEGTVGLGEGGTIVRLRGERFGQEAEGGDYIGVAALGGEALDGLPARGCLVGDFALPLLRAGGKIATVCVPGGFRDVGSIASYHAACLAWLERLDSSGARPFEAWVHPSAQVGANVALRQSIVGKGAVVAGEGVVDRCVIWPGATARAPLSDAIVTTGGQKVDVARLAASAGAG
jgi:mannose-1-phosphate guanylyltransferase